MGRPPRVNKIIYLKGTSEQGISQLIKGTLTKGFWNNGKQVKFLKGSREYVIAPFLTLRGGRSSERNLSRTFRKTVSTG